MIPYAPKKGIKTCRYSIFYAVTKEQIETTKIQYKLAKNAVEDVKLYFAPSENLSLHLL